MVFIFIMKNQQSQTSEDTSQVYTHHSSLFPNTYIKIYQLYLKQRGKNAENQSYDKEMEPIANIRTLQEFFNYYSSLKLPSEFEVNVKVMLFEEKCIPRWEDWVESGCFLLQFKECKEEQDCLVLDEVWEYLIFSMVGNQLDKDIIGICLNKHEKQTLIEVWLRHNDRKDQIGAGLQKSLKTDLEHICMKIKKPIKAIYKDHQISIQKNSTMKGTQKIAFIQSNKTH